jgi:hypothetical protein
MTMRSLTESELEAVSGGGGSDKGTSETYSGRGSGTVSGTAAGSGSVQHSFSDCDKKLLK